MSSATPGILAVAQPFCRDIEAALAQVERSIECARAKGAGLVVLPECALGGYLREPNPGESAPDLPPALDPDGPEIRRLVQMAGDTTVCIGYTEIGAKSPYSAAVCVSGDGVLGRHRKVHVPPAERFAYAAGDRFEAFDTPVGRIGMLLCYDKLFPEAAAALAVDGAETIVSMAAWPADRHRPAARIADDRQTRHFDLIDQARAVENQVVWVSANGTGRWGPLRFLGRSKVVDPDGTVLASTGSRAGMAFADVDRAGVIGTIKRHIDHLADRRPHAYRAGAHSRPHTGSLSG
jgi:predicted amidohydrolase